MLQWLGENIGTILISLGLVAAVIAIIAVIRRDKKKGKPCCGGDCGHCHGCDAGQGR